MKVILFLSTIFFISTALAQNVGGCIGGLAGAILGGNSQSNNNANEVAAQKTKIAMENAKQFFENRKSCREDLADAQIELLEAQDKFAQKAKLLPVKLAKSKTKYKKELHELKKQCDETAGKSFEAYRQYMDGDGVVSVRDGGPQALIGRSEKINRHRKLFYDDCLASEMNIEAVEIAGEELRNNLMEINALQDSASETLANITKRIKLKQSETIEICKMADELQDYLAKVATQQTASSNASSQNNGLSSIIGAIGNCIGGGGSKDATGSSATNSSG